MQSLSHRLESFPPFALRGKKNHRYHLRWMPSKAFLSHRFVLLRFALNRMDSGYSARLFLLENLHTSFS
jgi:hypothetical protein